MSNEVNKILDFGCRAGAQLVIPKKDALDPELICLVEYLG